MTTLGDVIIYIKGDTSDADQAIARVAQGAQQMAGQVSGFFRQAFAVAAGGLIQQGASGLLNLLTSIPQAAGEAVADFEMLTTSMESVIAKELVQAGVAEDFNAALAMSGQLAQENLGWLERLAIQSPFETDQIAAAFQMANSYGFLASAASTVEEAQRQGIVTAQRLAQAMTNQVAASGRSPEVMTDIARSLGQMNLEGKVTTEALNELATSGINARQILADRFTGGSVAELKTLVEQGLLPADQAILAIVEDMEIMSSAAARAGSTWRGLLASLSDIATQGMRTLITPALDQVKPLVAGLVSQLQSPAVQGALQSIGQGLGTFVGGAVERLTGLLGGFAAGWRAVAPAIQSAWVIIQAFGLIVQQLLAQAGSWLTSLAAPFLQGRQVIGDAMLQTGQAVELGLAVIPVTAGRILGGLVQAFAQAVQGWLAPWQAGFAQAAQDLAQFGTVTASTLGEIPGVMGSILGGLAGQAGVWGSGVVAAFADGMASAIGYVVDALSSIADTVSYWLTPGSPPPLLPDLDRWGAGSAEAWLGGWSDARFDALEQFGSMADRMLKTLVGSGQMGQGEAANVLLGAQGGMIAALEELRRTGQVSASTLGQITADAGPAAAGLGELAQQYFALAQASETLAAAEAELEAIETDLALAQGDIAAAQASGDAALLAEARNREAGIRQWQKDARLQQSNARRQQQAAEASLKQQERMLEVQQRMLDLQQQTTQEQQRGGGGGGKAKQQVDAVAEAQWRHSYAVADTATRLEMLRQKQRQYTQDTREYWDLQTQIAGLEGQQAKEQEQAQKQAEADAKQTRDQVERVAEAQWQYSYSVQDTAGKLQMLRDKQAGYTQDQEEYWRLAQQIAATEEQLRSEQEQAAKARGAGGVAKGPGAGAGGPDLGAIIRENVNRAQGQIVQSAQEAGERLVDGVSGAVRARADVIRSSLADALARAAGAVDQALAPIQARIQALLGGGGREGGSFGGGRTGGSWEASLVQRILQPFQTLQVNLAGIFGGIGGAWLGLRIAMLKINWLAVARPLMTAASNIWKALTVGGPVASNVMGLVRGALMGLVNPFTILVTLGAALGAAWAQNLGGIRDNVMFFLGQAWSFIQAVGAQILLFWEQNGASILATVGQAWTQLSTIVGTVVSILALVIGSGLGAIAGFLSTHSAEIQTILGGAWQLISGIVTGALGFIQGVVGAVLAVLQGDWGAAWTNIQMAVTSILVGIGTAIIGALEMIAGFFGTSLAGLGALWSSNWQMFLSILSTIWGIIVTTVTAKAGELYTAVTTKIAEVKSWWDTTWGQIRDTLGSIWDTIVTTVTEKVQGVYDAVFTKVEEVKTWIGDQVGSFATLGGNLIMGMVDGVVAKAVDLATAVTDAVLGALGAGQETAQTGSPSRLFRDELGRSIGQGIPLGVTDERPAAVAAVADTVAAMAAVPAHLPATAARGAPGGGAVGGLASAATDQVVGLLGEIATLLRGGAAQPVAIGPNTITSELDLERLAYQVFDIAQRKRRAG